MGRSSRTYSRGSYSRSASCTTTTSPSAYRKPTETAAPFPWFFGCRKTRTLSLPSMPRRMSRVPSVDPSSTIRISFSTGTACTWRTISSTVLASLYTGITTDSFKAGTPFPEHYRSSQRFPGRRQFEEVDRMADAPRGSAARRDLGEEVLECLGDLRRAVVTPVRRSLRQVEGGDGDESAAYCRLGHEVRDTQAGERVVSPEIRHGGLRSSPEAHLGGQALQVQTPVQVRVGKDSSSSNRSAGESIEIRQLVRMDAGDLCGRQNRKSRH